MSRHASRPTRGRIAELVLAAVAVIGIWVFFQLGGPSAVGEWIGPMFAPRP